MTSNSIIECIKYLPKDMDNIYEWTYWSGQQKNKVDSRLLTSVVPYKFKIVVLGSKVESASHKDREKTSPLSTSNFNEVWICMLCCLCKTGRIALISEGTAVSLFME
jgi:hypothetical protein